MQLAPERNVCILDDNTKHMPPVISVKILLCSRCRCTWMMDPAQVIRTSIGRDRVLTWLPELQALHGSKASLRQCPHPCALTSSSITSHQDQPTCLEHSAVNMPYAGSTTDYSESQSTDSQFSQSGSSVFSGDSSNEPHSSQGAAWESPDRTPRAARHVTSSAPAKVDRTPFRQVVAPNGGQVYVFDHTYKPE